MFSTSLWSIDLEWRYLAGKFCLAAVVVAAMWTPSVLAQNGGAPTVAESFFPTHSAEVVFIKVIDTSSNTTLPATGTGTLLQNGYVLTAKHVVAAFGTDPTDITGSVGLRYGNAVPLDLVVNAQDPLDLALLKFREVPAVNREGVHIGNPGLLKVGASLLTMSFPGDYGLSLTPTQITSAGKAGRWLATAELLPGSSGGPVFDPAAGGVIAIIQTGAPGSAEVIPINQASPLLLSAGYGIGPLAVALGFQDSDVRQLLTQVGANTAANPVNTLVNAPPKAPASLASCAPKSVDVDLTNPQNSSARDVPYHLPADAGCRINAANYRDLSRTRADVVPSYSATEATLKVHLDGVPLFGARSWAHGVFEVTQIPAH
jgi:Trypsin-like peptidase domain